MSSLSLRRVHLGLRGLAGSLLHGYPLTFNPDKRELIDAAFRGFLRSPRSVADLGGVWRVDGAYSLYALRKYRLESVYLIDTDLTPKVTHEASRHPGLRLIQGNFGDPSVRAQIGRVDAVLLFDVLLHQVRPDWDEILRLYATATDCFLVFNQQFIAGETTVRLPDLGPEEYFRHVRMDPGSPGYRELFEAPSEIHPGYNRAYRDVHNVWQWGITDRDLIETMTALGFTLRHRRNHGQFGDFESFENHAFIFARG